MATATSGGGQATFLQDSGQANNRPDLIGSIRQLVGSVTAKLKVSPTAVDGIEEAMAKLEATDENFNRYVEKTCASMYGDVWEVKGHMLWVQRSNIDAEYATF